MNHDLLAMLHALLPGAPRLKAIDTPRGPQANAPCPFHSGGQEMHPSFYMHLTTGMYFCHACGASGHLPSFVRRMGGDRYWQGWAHAWARETVPAATTPTALQPRSWLGKERHQSILSTNPVLPEWTLGHFDFESVALAAVFGSDLLDAYDIGYDFQHARITFPLRDLWGRLVGFSGRDDGLDRQPKYLFYGARELGEWAPPGYRLEKRVLCWNADRVWRRALFEPPSTPLWVVEGFKAALALIAHGYPNTVAILGARMSSEQRYILSCLPHPVILLLDNNAAGRAGTAAAVNMWQRYGTHPLYPARYPSSCPESAQPDDLSPEQIADIHHAAICSFSTKLTAPRLSPHRGSYDHT